MIRNAAELLTNIPQTANNGYWKVLQNKNDPEVFVICWRNGTPLFTFRVSELTQSFPYGVEDFDPLEWVTE